MSVSAVHSSAVHSSAVPAQQPVQARVVDKDHDGDNDATESRSAKAAEAAKVSTPVNSNLGKNVNTFA